MGHPLDVAIRERIGVWWVTRITSLRGSPNGRSIAEDAASATRARSVAGLSPPGGGAPLVRQARARWPKRAFASNHVSPVNSPKSCSRSRSSMITGSPGNARAAVSRARRCGDEMTQPTTVRPSSRRPLAAAWERPRSESPRSQLEPSSRPVPAVVSPWRSRIRRRSPARSGRGSAGITLHRRRRLHCRLRRPT